MSRWHRKQGTTPRAPGSIRIIGGSLRGSRLPVPDAPGLRPTSDRIRETLFNWLAPVISGARALDLYAGTGALGLEALSRGAREVVLVEHDPALADGLKQTIARLKVDGANVVNGAAERYLAGGSQPFDVVFLDPPYDEALWREAAQALEQGAWLAADARIYLESPRGTVPELPPNWVLQREGEAGAVRYALYRREAIGMGPRSLS
jgi:16S rRNA (guanine966-N2)-methyltransferase